MTAREEFLASAGIREERFELLHNDARLVGIVRIHPAKRYRELMQLDNISFEMLADQFQTIEDRSPLFAADELESILPEVVLEKLCRIFVKANTGKDPADIKTGEDQSPAAAPQSALRGCSSPNSSGSGISTLWRRIVRIASWLSGKNI